MPPRTCCRFGGCWARFVCATAAMALVLLPAVLRAQPATSTQPQDAALANAAAAARVTGEPATVRFGNRDIVTFRAEVLLRSPDVRRMQAERLLDTLTRDSVRLAVSSRPLAGSEIISLGTRDVFAIVPADLDLASSDTVSDVAEQTVARLQQAVDEVIEARTPRRLLEAGTLALVATIALVALLRLLARGRAAALAFTIRTAKRQLQRLPAGELVRETPVVSFLQYAVTVTSVVLGAMLIYAWLTFVLRRFPYTRPWGEALRAFLLERLTTIGASILAAFPNLFTVLLIVLIARLAVKLTGAAFEAVAEGRATIPGVYPETAQPTRRLVAVVVYLFALAVAYPYLPGAQSDAFKGVSVFVGLMISLGSSGIVNQLMSGFTVTYSRALRQGDFVRIGDVEGTVTQLGSLSIKLKTPRREEVTIPNAVVVGTQTTNYSRFAEADGVYFATVVTIGYDVPWRQVHALLLLASARTCGVRTEPAPAVRQSALRDFYVEYTLLVSLEEPALRGPTLDRLHQEIQDAFNEHGVQIMSPNYEADPAAPKIVPRDRWFTEPAPAAFNQHEARSVVEHH